MAAPAGKAFPEFHGGPDGPVHLRRAVTGEKELYDHTVDPYELNNIAATASPSLLASLHAQVVALQTCTGASCRTADL